MISILYEKYAFLKWSYTAVCCYLILQSTKIYLHFMKHFFHTAYSLRVMRKLESIPAHFRCKAGYTLDRSTYMAGPSHRQTSIHTHVPFRIYNSQLPNHVFGLQKEMHACTRNTCRLRKLGLS